MKVHLQGHKKRTEDAMKFWHEFAKEINSGMPIEVARLKFPNKRTGKPYDLSHVYLMLRRINTPTT